MLLLLLRELSVALLLAIVPSLLIPRDFGLPILLLQLLLLATVPLSLPLVLVIDAAVATILAKGVVTADSIDGDVCNFRFHSSIYTSLSFLRSKSCFNVSDFRSDSFCIWNRTALMAYLHQAEGFSRTLTFGRYELNSSSLEKLLMFVANDMISRN